METRWSQGEGKYSEHSESLDMRRLPPPLSPLVDPHTQSRCACERTKEVPVPCRVERVREAEPAR